MSSKVAICALMAACLVGVALGAQSHESAAVESKGKVSSPFARPLAWIRCAVEVDRDDHTDPFTGTDQWWQANYPIMQEFSQRCNTAFSLNVLHLTGMSAANPQKDFQLLHPAQAAIVFQLGADRTAYLTLPIAGQMLENLPGGGYPGARFTASLECRKTWTTQTLNLKACDIAG